MYNNSMSILFLIQAIDPQVAYAVVGGLVTALGIVWRRMLVVEERSQKNLERALDSINSNTSAIEALTKLIEKNNEHTA